MKLYLLLLTVGFGFSSFASDHIDGPVTSANRVADLTDLYAFPTPQKPGFLSIILDAYPIVPASGHFTDKVNYNILIRKASVQGRGVNSSFQTSDEIKIQCNFKTPAVTANHVILCKTSNALQAASKYEEVTPGALAGDFRVYSGMRSDPFFFNAEWATKVSTKGVLPTTLGSDTMEGVNVLTIVLEIEMAKLFKEAPGSMFALSAETTTQDSPTSPLRRLDRIGRPEITNASLVAHGGDPDLRDGYNLDQPFHVAPEKQKIYEERLFKNISYYDELDKQKNWQDGDRRHLAQILVEDFLVVDIAKPCGPTNFFAIERAMLTGQDSSSCGGRHPNDDIMDILFSLYIGGQQGPRLRDGVDQPSQPIQKEFPYLAPPELGILARTKAFLGRKVLGL